MPAERVALGNGAAELLFTLVQLLCAGGRTLLTVEPTFSEPAAAVRGLGRAAGRACAPGDGDGFRVDVGRGGRRRPRLRGRRGLSVQPAEPHRPRVAHRAGGGAGRGAGPPGRALILDEAFLSVSTRWEDARRPLPADVVRVRSFTKEHGVPGLRLGALMGPVELVQRLEAARPSWTVGAPAQAAIAVCATPEAEAHVAASANAWRRTPRDLASELERAGATPLPTDTVFLLMRGGEREQRCAAGCWSITRSWCATARRSGCPITCAWRAAQSDRQRLLAALAD